MSFETVSNGSSKYFVSFIDDAFKSCAVYFHITNQKCSTNFTNLKSETHNRPYLVVVPTTDTENVSLHPRNTWVT